MQACGAAATRLRHFSEGDDLVAQPQRLEIRFLGTTIRAEGIAGIVGAIAIISVILTAYFN